MRERIGCMVRFHEKRADDVQVFSRGRRGSAGRYHQGNHAKLSTYNSPYSASARER